MERKNTTSYFKKNWRREGMIIKMPLPILTIWQEKNFEKESLKASLANYCFSTFYSFSLAPPPCLEKCP
ncbi:hypothetical protein OF001_U220027 [Pseudomonas sp. OF001]|nr:hypothetical protein OF001_U220027 [Pseudomonas sp. OF001]